MPGTNPYPHLLAPLPVAHVTLNQLDAPQGRIQLALRVADVERDHRATRRHQR